MDIIKRVFISHPYRRNPSVNMRKVENVCNKIKEEYDGVIPISPLHLFSFAKPGDLPRIEIMNTCYDLIDICDEVWIYGTSEGCMMEREYAESQGIKVVVKN